MKPCVLGALMLLAACPAFAADEDQPAVDACIASWGKASPFHKGAKPETILATGVKVFGVGSSSTGNDAPLV